MQHYERELQSKITKLAISNEFKLIYDFLMNFHLKEIINLFQMNASKDFGNQRLSENIYLAIKERYFMWHVKKEMSILLNLSLKADVIEDHIDSIYDIS